MKTILAALWICVTLWFAADGIIKALDRQTTAIEAQTELVRIRYDHP